eukprot:COSAG01_NODE_404_length_17467_cov_69.758650_19_plen_59_part_00
MSTLTWNARAFRLIQKNYYLNKSAKDGYRSYLVRLSEPLPLRAYSDSMLCSILMLRTR